MSPIRMILVLVADLAMLGAGYYYGIRLLRRRPNFLLGLEWLVIAVSGTNVLILAATGVMHSGLSYHLMVFFDAFSRSFGMTLLIVLGMAAVTHRYRPGWIVEALAIAAGVAVGLNRALDPRPVEPAWSVFYLVMNLGVAVFMLVFVAARLWRLGDHRNAVWVCIATALGAGVAVIYDYFPIPGDDAEHSLFYILSLSVWALMLVTYYHGYRSLEERCGSDASDPGAIGSTPARAVDPASPKPNSSAGPYYDEEAIPRVVPES